MIRNVKKKLQANIVQKKNVLKQLINMSEFISRPLLYLGKDADHF